MHLKDCQYADTTKQIDVRVKIFIYYSNKKISILCIDKFNNILLNGKLIKENSQIIKFIDDQN